MHTGDDHLLSLLVRRAHCDLCRLLSGVSNGVGTMRGSRLECARERAESDSAAARAGESYSGEQCMIRVSELRVCT